MKLAMICDLKTLAPFLPPIFITLAFICAFLTLGGSSIAAVGSVAVMMVLLCVLSFAGYDEQNGWGRYRATLPFSRCELMISRYLVVFFFGVAGVLIAVVMGGVFQVLFRLLPGVSAPDGSGMLALLGSSVVSVSWGLVICYVAMPLTVKFGAMRGMLVFACGLGIFALLGVAIGVEIIPAEGFANLAGWVEANLVVGIVGCIVVSLIAYIASCATSIVIYESKDL